MLSTVFVFGILDDITETETTVNLAGAFINTCRRTKWPPVHFEGLQRFLEIRGTQPHASVTDVSIF